MDGRRDGSRSTPEKYLLNVVFHSCGIVVEKCPKLSKLNNNKKKK